MSREAAARVIAAAAAKSDSLLCVPAGNSPAGLYQELIREAGRKPDLFRSLRVVKLDEWLGVLASDPASLRTFPQEPAPRSARRSRRSATSRSIRKRRIHCGNAPEYKGSWSARDPIDLCILGLGKNGHVGLNEPGPSLKPLCHVAKLSEETLRHAMISPVRPSPIRADARDRGHPACPEDRATDHGSGKRAGHRKVSRRHRDHGPARQLPMAAPRPGSLPG